MTQVQDKVFPPGPAEHLDIASTADPLAPLMQIFEQYGDLYRFYCPTTRAQIYVLTHPEHAKHVLITNYKNYTKGFGIDRVKILLGLGIMTSEGDFWHRQRRMIQPAFHRNVISQFLPMVREKNLTLRAKWDRCAEQGTPVNVDEDTSDMTLGVVLESIFSVDLARFVAEHGGNPFLLVTEESARNLQFAARFRALGGIIQNTVDRRRSEDRRPLDLLSILIDARDRQTDEAMSDRQLIDEVMTLIIAGHETTASALAWTWYLLSRHPEAAARLRDEIARFPANLPMTLESLQQLVYTRQVIEESLRLYPPGWLLTRKALAEDEIAGYTIEEGAHVFVSPYMVHRNPQFWPEPERFDPDRFAPGAEEGRHMLAYIPFGAGPRRCIGEQLAILEMLIHFFVMARGLELRYLGEAPPALEPQVNLRPRDAIHMLPIRHA